MSGLRSSPAVHRVRMEKFAQVAWRLAVLIAFAVDLSAQGDDDDPKLHFAIAEAALKKGISGSQKLNWRRHWRMIPTILSCGTTSPLFNPKETVLPVPWVA